MHEPLRPAAPEQSSARKRTETAASTTTNANAPEVVPAPAIPVTPINLALTQAQPQRDYHDQRVEMFEGWKARTSATVLQIGAFVLLGGSAYRNAEHWWDWVPAFAFHGALWMLPHAIVHRQPRTLVNDLGFAACIGVLLGQPHTEICRRVPYIGALHGSASVMVMVRAFQYYMNQDEFRGWKRWRRMFFISAWGWHDFRQNTFVGEAGARARLKPEVSRLVRNAIAMFACVGFHVWQGAPAEAVSGMDPKSVAYIRYYMARWAVGFLTLLSWFNCMDAFVRSLHFWADAHEVRPISEDPWGARTLKDFWGRRWDVPVQEMLIQGVYGPISKLKWLPLRKTLAKLMVFVVSGAAHSYAISCGGSPWAHLRMMFAFFMVQIPLIATEDAFKLKGMAWMLGSEVPFAPLFIEPILSFCHI